MILNGLLLPAMKDLFIVFLDSDSGDLGRVRKDPAPIERASSSYLARRHAALAAAEVPGPLAVQASGASACRMAGSQGSV